MAPKLDHYEGPKPIDKGTISIINAALICVTMMGVAAGWQDLKSRQDKTDGKVDHALLLIESHTPMIQDTAKKVADITSESKQHSQVVWLNRWDRTEMRIFSEKLAEHNPTLRVPNSEDIWIETKPYPPPQ